MKETERERDRRKSICLFWYTVIIYFLHKSIGGE